MTWPVPSQPGVGHLISRFSALEGSKHTRCIRSCREKTAWWVASGEGDGTATLLPSRCLEHSGQTAQLPGRDRGWIILGTVAHTGRPHGKPSHVTGWAACSGGRRWQLAPSLPTPADTVGACCLQRWGHASRAPEPRAPASAQRGEKWDQFLAGTCPLVLTKRGQRR